MYKILESESSNSHLADYVLYKDKIEENEIFNIKNMIKDMDAITLENSFVALWFDRFGLMEVCSE